MNNILQKTYALRLFITNVTLLIYSRRFVESGNMLNASCDVSGDNSFLIVNFPDRRLHAMMKEAIWVYTKEGLFADTITRRWTREVNKSHRKRVRESQPVVDCAPPSTLGLPLGRNQQFIFQAKKYQILKDRQFQIYLENMRLARAMADILNPHHAYRSPLLAAWRSCRQQPPLMKGDALYTKRSLNELERRKESARIDTDRKLMKLR